MRKPVIYLAGPIADCDDDQAHGWRNRIKEMWPEATFLNPMKRDNRTYVMDTNDVVEFDKIEINQADAVIVNPWKISVGTSMEILYAWMKGKIVIVIMPDYLLSDWVVYHCHRLANDEAHAVDTAKSLLEALVVS